MPAILGCMNHLSRGQRRTLLGSGISLAAFAGLYAAIAGSGYELRRVSPGTAQAAVSTGGAASAETASPPATAASTQNVFVNISDRMIPSVVNIFTTQKPRSRPQRFPGFPSDPWGELFDQGYGGEADEGPARGQVPMSLGTGFIVEAERGGGLIITNHHVIAGADGVKVKFTENSDENEVTAEIIGRDPELDIALLRVRTDRKLEAVALGDSDQLKVGEWIAAVGNPFGHGHSVTHGIVSAKERTLPGGFGKYLQVDAPINPGNSGGPLVNMQGQVVGINNAIDARGPGIGFAIPVNSLKELLPQLKSSGRVDRGYLGVNVMPLKPELARALKSDAPAGAPVVANVAPGTPAAKAGIEPYDIIAKVDGHPLKSTEQLVEAILKVPVGRKVATEVIRGGKRLQLEVRVERRPEPHRT